MDVNILLFPDFETLDTFGAVEVLGQVEEYHLHYFSMTGGIITSRQGAKITTEKLVNINPLGILLIPGGQGTRPLTNDVDFIKILAEIAVESQYCLTVCTGSVLLAKTGLLDGRRATSNKKAFEWVKTTNTKVVWISHARWVVDDKFYTSSGISAGIDMALGFVADRFSTEKAKSIAQSIEYIWNSDKNNDCFAQ
jgi:transcriptional regulator GlxA family with amidase domain